MAERSFEITYDGPALKTGEMPVQDLAPALLALGNLFTEASAILYPESEPVTVNIKATNEGSFSVDLVLHGKHAWDQFVSFFSSDQVTALGALLAFLLAGGSGLIWLTKHIGTRSISDTESDGVGTVALTLDDGSAVKVPTEVLTLYRNVPVRTRAKEVIAPIKRDGVDSVRFASENDPVVVEKSDVPAFDLPDVTEEELVQEIEMLLEITSLAFIETNKWRFSDGAQIFSASLEDEGFFSRIEDGSEVFRKGDMLRCRVRIVQLRKPTGLHTEHHVAEVLEHVPRPTQMSLGESDGFV